MVISSLALLIAQPNIENVEIKINEAQSQRINLSPPIHVPIRVEKIQTHHISDKQVKIHLIRDIIFTPSSNDNIIGYDISAEIIDVKIEGDSKIINIFANAYPKVGSISQYSYDYANEKLELLNADKIWNSMIDSINQIEHNAGKRTQDQQQEYETLINSVKNIPPLGRKAILSQDMALLLSFTGKILTYHEPDIDNMLIMVSKNNERQNGLIMETSNFYISRQTGLVHKLVRINQSQGDKNRKIITQIELKLP